MAAPWEKYANPSANYGADPYKVNEEQRKQQAAMLAQQDADRAAAQAAQANQNSAVSNANSTAATQLARERFEYEKNKGGGAADTQKLANLRALERQIAEVRGLYNSNLKGGNPLQSLGEYLPFAENRAFDSAGKALAETGFGAFRVPGVGSQSDSEGARFVEAYAPSASDQDSVIEQKLTNLENRLRDTYREMGIEPRQQEPDSQPPAPQQNDQMSPAGVNRSNQSDVLFGGPGDQGGGGGFAAYNSISRSAPNPQWQGVNEAVKGMIISGRPSQEIKAFMNSKGIAGDATTGIDEAVRYYQKTGKTNFGVDVENMSVPMSGLQQFANNAPQTRIGTAAATALNAGGLGIPQMLAGGQGLDYLRSVNPKSAFAGDVAGVIGGTAALGKAGGAVAGRLAPSLLGGGGKAAAGRQLATDAAYGGIYGATTEGDPLTGALTAGVGSAGGQLIGRGIQRGLQGGGTDAARALREMGIPITAGQALGGMAQRVENAATTFPFVGDTITKRYGEGFEGFNREAFRQGGAPIGATVDDIGAAGLDASKPQINAGYSGALRNANVPIDGEGIRGIQNSIRTGQQLPDDLRGRFDSAIANRVNPITGQLPPAPEPIFGLPMPSSFNKPRNPTPEEMARFARPEDVDLTKARGGQSVMDWQRFNSGDYADPLIDGYGSKPVGIRLENGEYVIADGNHRTTTAFNQGKSTLPMDVIDARAYDPQNMGRASNDGGMSTDDLLRELGGNPSAPAPAPIQPMMTGEQYQQAMRGLAGYKAEMTKPGFEADYRDALSGVQDSLKGVMMRQGGESVVSGLRNADEAYRNSKVLGKAVDSARNGSRTGEVEMFSPSQLNDASVANARKYGGNGSTTNRPFYELATLGQKVLPSKLANSGTTERMLAGAGLLGTGTGASAYASGADPYATAAPLATTGLLTLLGTKQGQKALVKVIMDRPKSLKKAGGIFGGRKARKALSGAITAPLLVE